MVPYLQRGGTVAGGPRLEAPWRPWIPPGFHTKMAGMLLWMLLWMFIPKISKRCFDMFDMLGSPIDGMVPEPFWGPYTPENGAASRRVNGVRSLRPTKWPAGLSSGSLHFGSCFNELIVTGMGWLWRMRIMKNKPWTWCIPFLVAKTRQNPSMNVTLQDFNLFFTRLTAKPILNLTHLVSTM